VTRAILLLVLLIVVACSASSASDERFVATTPDRASFPHVAEMLVHTCGTLDCHGSPYRNLRLYGDEGMRWAATDRPLVPSTTNDEVEQDWDSVVGLEPEILSKVVEEAGAHPERLTLVRKARGEEAHKAGAIVQVGDDRDVCLTSWLAGKTDLAKCDLAAKE
jgi:hypothetical protein